jgi:hypothetical protein
MPNVEEIWWSLVTIGGLRSLAAAKPIKSPAFGAYLVRTKQSFRHLMRRRGTGALQVWIKGFMVVRKLVLLCGDTQIC